MKLHELHDQFTNKTPNPLEDILGKRLRELKWLSAPEPEILKVEGLMIELWRADRVLAQKIWEENSPVAIKGLVPSFIIHHAIKENWDWESWE